MTFTLHPQLAADSIIIGAFPISLLLMINDAAYPWFVLVPQIPNIKDAYQLSEAQHMAVTRESRSLCTALMAAFATDIRQAKMNVAALGNMVPQLHIHHIVRSPADPAWPAPIWGHQLLTPLTKAEIAARIKALLQNLPQGLELFDR